MNPADAFPPERFGERRERVLERLGEGALVVPSAPPARRGRDTEYRYRPDPDLFYLTGLTEPGVVAVLRGFSEEDRFVLFVRPRDPKAERWEGPRLGPEAAAERTGADRAFPLDALGAELPGLLADAGTVYFRLGADAPAERAVRVALARGRESRQRSGRGPAAVVDPGVLLDELRVVKDGDEIAALRRAADLTAEAHRAAAAAAGPGVGEWEIEAAFDAAVRRGGALGVAFPTIVASGPSAAVLHYTANARRVGATDLVLVDGGAEVALYAGDVSRTFPAAGRFTPEQRAVYEVVAEAHRRAVAAVAPGATVQGIHETVLRTLVEGLVALGVLAGEVDALLRGKAYEPYFPHRTSHWVGLDVHDPGGYVAAGRPRPLEPGMVLTVEPGLYFPADVGGTAASFSGIGVRLEDVLLVTEDGAEVLSAGLPTDPEEVAALPGR